jgi:hypothetical protein
VSRVDPPFRADHVGSLLRAPEVLEARAQLAAGTISPADLRAAEDAVIARNVATLESLGMRSITDGEQRRARGSISTSSSSSRGWPSPGASPRARTLRRRCT